MLGADPLAKAAVAGDVSAFAALVDRHRREIELHCYRMLGSLEEAEDVAQETFLRAWSKLALFRFEGRASFRAWLYRIATNAALDVLDRRARRVLPADLGPSADPRAPLPATAALAWLEPYPDHRLEGVASRVDDPDAVVVARETIELAFLAAIQHLPPRQRAVLILRDVVGWSARETAAVLGTTVASVTSALQRARATLGRHVPPERVDWAPSSHPSAEERGLLERYMAAHESGDVDALAKVLRDDVRFSFPPRPLWYEGRDAFLEARRRFASPGAYRFLATAANRQPATAVYVRRAGAADYVPLGIEVLRVEDGVVAEVVDFAATSLFPAFHLPPRL